MDELKKLLIYLAIFAALTYVYQRYFTERHEQAHAAICKQFGGNATIQYKKFNLEGVTTCKLPDDKKDDMLVSANANVEATYPIEVMVSAIIAAALILKVL